MSYEWDNKKPTAQMLGRWQPFHDGHYALFEEIIKKTGQVCIQVRDVKGVDDNPFDFEVVKARIIKRLEPKYKNRFKVVLVPNITNICYGRGVGYKIEEIVLSEEIQNVNIPSSTVNFGNAYPGDAVMNDSDPFIINFEALSSIGELEFQLNITSNIDGHVKNEQSFPIILNVVEQYVMLGDLNEDSFVNILDIVQIVNIILGDTPTQYQLEAGDLNLDGIVNVIDIVNIVNMIIDEE